MRRSSPLPTLIAATLALAACGSSGPATANAAANEVDPALTSALEDQILVDPNLVQQAHPHSARPPEAPVQAQYPAGAEPRVQRAAMTPGQLAVGADGAPCGGDLAYGPQWADRLPATFPPYPGGRVTEAAGLDSPTCRLRVVTFRTADPAARVLDWYRGAATRAGFSAEQQQRGADLLLGGVHAPSDGAFVVIVTPAEGGSDVALIVNNGR